LDDGVIRFVLARSVAGMKVPSVTWTRQLGKLTHPIEKSTRRIANRTHRINNSIRQIDRAPIQNGKLSSHSATLAKRSADFISPIDVGKLPIQYFDREICPFIAECFCGSDGSWGPHHRLLEEANRLLGNLTRLAQAWHGTRTSAFRLMTGPRREGSGERPIWSERLWDGFAGPRETDRAAGTSPLGKAPGL